MSREYSPFNAVLRRAVPTANMDVETLTYRISKGETVEELMRWAFSITERENCPMVSLEITQSHRKPDEDADAR